VCFPRRPFTIPQILRKGNKPELEEEGEDEEEEETLQVLRENPNRPTQQFKLSVCVKYNL